MPKDPNGFVIVSVLAAVETTHVPDDNPPERTHAALVERGTAVGKVITISEVVFN